MAVRSYANFDLLISTADSDDFSVTVVDAPVGLGVQGRNRLPFDPVQLRLLLVTLDPGRSGVRRVAASRVEAASEQFGSTLFDAVFGGEVGEAWSASRAHAWAQGHGLRLRLRLQRSPSLAGLPWELLFDRSIGSYIARSERTPVVRYFDVPHSLKPLAVSGPLRVLVVISYPIDLTDLDGDAEWGRMKVALRGRVEQGSVLLRRGPPQMAALRSYLDDHEVHVLHFIGHGDFDDRLEDGVLFFTDKYGRSDPVTAARIGSALGDHDPLRLVVLNACLSARVDSTDPFSGMAQGLIQQDCAAVVAMQFPVSDGAAATFTEALYGRLSQGYPLDQAVSRGRQSLLDQYATEWATPVVFLRSDEATVFTIDDVDATPTPTEQPWPEGLESGTVQSSDATHWDDSDAVAGEPQRAPVLRDTPTTQQPEAPGQHAMSSADQQNPPPPTTGAQTSAEEADPTRSIVVAELERRGYSLGDSRRGETSPDIYYADGATHTKPRIIVSRTRIRIQTKTAATPYKDWKSFSRKTELELALESIDRLPQSGKPTTAGQAAGQDDRPRSGEAVERRKRRT